MEYYQKEFPQDMTWGMISSKLDSLNDHPDIQVLRQTFCNELVSMLTEGFVKYSEKEFEFRDDSLWKVTLDNIEKLTKDRISEYITSSNQLRAMMFNQYFSDHKKRNIYIPDSILENQLVWVIGRDDVNEIQSIKNKGTALTVGSMALGFVPGIGAIAIGADVVDLAYGLTQDGQINNALTQMADTIYSDSSRCIDNYLTDVFTSLTKSQKETESNIIKIFNDEF